jgi:gliding motility-associated protein GldL
MKKITLFFETWKGKRIKNLILGWGASLVLLGALFKIQHWPAAGVMLTIGMCTEAFIFALQGTLPPHKDYYWEKLYPDLDISPEVEEEEGAEASIKGSPVEQIDQGLQESAEVGPEVIERLGSNLNKLGEHLNRLTDLTDASEATDEYSRNAKAAAESLDQMKDAYAKATEAAAQLSTIDEDAENYKEQMQSVSKNLSSLNELYEMELQASGRHKEQMDKFHENIAQVVQNLQESVEDTRRYKEQVGSLAENLTQLNTIYGNMLSAMGGNQG